MCVCVRVRTGRCAWERTWQTSLQPTPSPSTPFLKDAPTLRTTVTEQGGLRMTASLGSVDWESAPPASLMGGLDG